MSRSKPCWSEQFDSQSFVQVIQPSYKNDHIVVGSRQFVKTVHINEANDGITTLRSMKSTTATTAVAFHPTADSVIASAGSNGEVSVWYYGAQNIAPLNDKWTAHSRAIHAMAFLPSHSGFLLTASADGQLNCWSLSSYTGKRELWAKPSLVANFRAEGLRSGLRDLDVSVFTTERSVEQSHKGQVGQRYLESTVCFRILVACDDGSVELYQTKDTLDLNETRLVGKLSVSTQTVNSCRFSPDGSMVATGGKDSYIRVFRLGAGGDSTFVPACSIRCQSPVWAIRWRPPVPNAQRPSYFIAACQSIMDSSIYVWDLDSRLMPAYVFNSHKDNVTDLFWADPHHLVSCSRDNTVQMHAVKNAVIPIEKMRTVNISFTLGNGGNNLSSVCDRVNREKFEKDHARLDLCELKGSGFPHNSASSSLSLGASCDSAGALEQGSIGTSRTVRIRSVRSTVSPESIWRASSSLTRFIQTVSKHTETAVVAKQCAELSLATTPAQTSDTLRLLGWMLSQSSDTISEATQIFLSSALGIARESNDVVLFLALGAVAMFSADREIAALVESIDFVQASKSLLDLLRRLGKWQEAAEFVFLSPLAEIRSLSHARTSVNIACAKCNRQQEGLAGGECEKCTSSLSDCTLCGERVKGLWVACRGCGHGGHLKHIDWWFSNFSICPVPDCQHQCR